MAVVNWGSLLDFYLTILFFFSQLFLLVLWIIAFRRLRLTPFAILIITGIFLLFVTGFNVCVGWNFTRVYDLLAGHYETFETSLIFVMYIATVMQVVGFTLLVCWILRHNRPNQAMQPTADPRKASVSHD